MVIADDTVMLEVKCVKNIQIFHHPNTNTTNNNDIIIKYEDPARLDHMRA